MAARRAESSVDHLYPATKADIKMLKRLIDVRLPATDTMNRVHMLEAEQDAINEDKRKLRDLLHRVWPVLKAFQSIVVRYDATISNVDKASLKIINNITQEIEALLQETK